MDTGINTIIDDKLYGISTDEKKLINRIQKLKNNYPNNVTIVMKPEDNDGCIVARFPKEWLKISPPRKVNMTDEKKQEAALRLLSNLSRQN